MNGALLTTKDVSEMLSVHPITLRVWRCRKVGPPWIVIGTRNIRYSPEDLDDWLAGRRVVPESTPSALEAGS